MARCLIATADLMGYSQLSGIARASGLDPVQVRGPDGIRSAAGPDLAAVLVDLGDAHGGPDAVAAGHALGVPVIAVGPHVRNDLFEAARTHGATHVLPHSAVAGRLGPLLQETLGDGAHRAPGPHS